MGLLAYLKRKRIERKQRKIEESEDFYAVLMALLLAELHQLGVSEDTIDEAFRMANRHVEEYFNEG